jgi:hypothetical protein
MKLNDKQKNILRFIGVRIASSLINVLLKTVRIRIDNSDVVKNFDVQKKNYVTAFWHGSMLIGWYITRNKNFASLVSSSRDGDILTAILEKWKYYVVRGSSSKGGHEALDGMIQLAKENYSLAITPDGPTGPIHKMKAGAVITAKRSQIPLLLVGIGIKSKWVLKSWDRFEIPKPFTKAVAVFSEPIMIDASLSREKTAEVIEKCESMLNNLQKETTKRCLSF